MKNIIRGEKMKNDILTLCNHNLPTDEFRNKKTVLSLNENVYGCSSKVKKILKSNRNYNLYPDDNCLQLRNGLAKMYNISTDNIMIGNGSGEILQIITRALVGNGDEVISCTPTYPYYLIETVIESGKFIDVPLVNDKFDIKGILKNITAKTKIIYITNPNNPTGTIITKEEQELLLENVPENITVVFDEAYYEYVTNEEYPDTISDLKKYPNICILRTFSKAYGLASMRIGYLIGGKNFIEHLDKVRLTFNTSKISQLAACYALEGQKFVADCRKKNLLVKEYLYNELDKLKIKYIKTEANFISIQLSSEKVDLIIQNNIMVKKYSINGVLLPPCQ